MVSLQTTRAGAVVMLSIFGTAAAAQDVTVLKVWDQFTDARQDAATAIYDEFMKQNPNIKIEREIYTFEQLQTTARLALRSGAGPDIMYIDVSPARELYHAGLLMNMDQYEESFGWGDRILATALDFSRDSTGLFGVGVEYEYVGMFYNATLIEDAGLTLPNTLDELLAFCAAASEAGYTPMAHSQNPGWQNFFSFVLPLNNSLGNEAVEELIFGMTKNWTDEDVVASMNVFHKDMVEAGCFVDQVNALDFDGAIDMFISGKALIFPTGTWVTAGISSMEDDGYEIGIVPFVSTRDNGPRIYTSGIGSIFVINSESEAPDEAAQLIDFMLRDEFGETWVRGGVVPPLHNIEVEDAGSAIQTQVLEEIAESKRGNTEFGYAINMFAPEEFNSVMQSGFQAVTAGQITAAEQGEALQAAWPRQ